MATVQGPLFSIAASDTLAKTLTFSRWKGRPYVRKRVIPANPRSGLQTGMRAGFSFMSKAYHNMSATIKGHWAALYKALHITGLDSAQRFNQPRIRQNKGPVQDPNNAAGAVEAAPTAVAATAQPKSVSLAWTDSIGANDWGTFIYMSTSTGFTPDVSNLIAIVAHGVQTFVKPKLITGTPYYFVLGGVETGGTLGSRAAQVTATPT